MRVRIFLVLLTVALALHGGSLEARNPRVQGIGDGIARADKPGYALPIAPWVCVADLSAVSNKAAWQAKAASSYAKPSVLVETNYPAYDPARLKRAFASATVGVAEVRDEISSRLSLFDCRYEKAGSRLSLGFFEGDVIVASGEWWSRYGRDLAGLLRGHLGRGVRIVVVECAGGGMSFADAPRAEGTGSPAIADPWHHVTGNPAASP